MAFFKTLLAAAFIAIHANPAQAAYCDDEHSSPLCCMGTLAPYSGNSYVWGNICGIQTSDPNELVAGRCIPAPNDDTDNWYVSSGPTITRCSHTASPYGSNPACCQYTVPGRKVFPADHLERELTIYIYIECALGVNCAYPLASPPTTSPTPIPSGWRTDYLCAVDVPSRILKSVHTYQDFTSLTPASCMALCASVAGKNYRETVVASKHRRH
jgi:hypothetical protein